MNINSKEISNKIENNLPMNNNIKEEDKISSNVSNSFPLMNYEYITKGRKTVYNSSKINLQSPKKENPSRSKRMTLLGKKDIDIQMNKKNSELFSFGKHFLDSSKKRNINESRIDDDNNQNLNHKKLIKRIAMQLKKRVRLPTCKIIKVYLPYRELIFRIANGIKKNFNQKKFEEKYKKKERVKFGPTLIKKDESIDSKKREIISQANNINENDENINLLLNIEDSIQNQNYINQFETFLYKNKIELSNDKLPVFKSDKNKYLLLNLYFWIKYIKYICQKYKEELSFFNYMNFIDFFYTWIDDTKYDCTIFNKLIIEQMELNFTKDKINNFLLIHKLKNLDDLFLRYKKLNTSNCLIEIKNIGNCECPSCQEVKQKVINYNDKNIYISYSEENNLSFQKFNEIIKYPQTKTLIDKNQENLTLNDNSTQKRITNYFRCSLELNKKKEEKKLFLNYTDKKLTDYFYYKKEKVEVQNKKEKEKDKSIKKSNKKSSEKNKSRSTSNNKVNQKKKKSNKKDKIKEIRELLNIDY